MQLLCLLIMASIKQLSVLHKIVRRMSNIAVKQGQATKFAVVNGKFVRVPTASPETSEEITHTGQYYEEGDWRKNRFHDRTKLVNRNWAVKMVAKIPPTEVDGRKAVCDGRDGPDAPAALGHPRVYINLDKGEVESCMYCGLRFVQKKH